MPRRGWWGDVTLRDSADSGKPVGRLRKTARRLDNDAFSQKDGKETTGRRGKSTASDPSPHQIYTEYPSEIWRLIGLQISPESVCTFARLCRSSYRVTVEPGFWLSIYHRFVSHTEQMDASNLLAFRCKVIRALYRVYRPLVQQSSKNTDRIVGARCCGTWDISSAKAVTAGDCTTCFLFQLPCHSDDEERHQRFFPTPFATVIRQRRRLFHNPDRGLVVLAVTTGGDGGGRACCLNVLGMVLTRVAVTVDVGAVLRLRLEFSQSGYREQGRTALASYHPHTLVISPIKQHTLLDWWDAQFVELTTCRLGALEDDW